jgi:hypothetical protein
MGLSSNALNGSRMCAGSNGRTGKIAGVTGFAEPRLTRQCDEWLAITIADCTVDVRQDFVQHLFAHVWSATSNLLRITV